MKTRILGIIITAFVAGAMSASCAKDNAVETQAAQNGAPRVIAVSFDRSTKSALSGNVASFTAGDVILVSNIMEKEECEVSVDASGKASITTTLLGTLKAVYPADAALLDGNAIKGVKVPSVQSGRFADANVTMAEEITNRAVFTVRTALFIITPPPGTLSLELKSLKQVEGGVARTGTAVPINTDGADDAARQLISVSGLDSDGKIYVALSAGAGLDDLSFDAKYAAAGSGSLKGIPASVASDPVALGTSYTVNGTGWHDYLEVGGRKWAKTNIGATSDKGTGSVGWFFPWAGTQGYVSNGSGGWVKADKPDEVLSGGFTDANAPFSAYAKYTTLAAALELVDDAAYVNWGGPWRMPTGTEYSALHKDCGGNGTAQAPQSGGSESTNAKGIYWCTDYGGIAGGLLHNGAGGLFFPVTGYIKGNDTINETTYGYFWSINYNELNRPLAFYVNSSGVSAQGNATERRYGFPIRPIADL